MQAARRKARPVRQVVSQNDEGILIENNSWDMNKICQLLPNAKKDENLSVMYKVMSWRRFVWKYLRMLLES